MHPGISRCRLPFPGLTRPAFPVAPGDSTGVKYLPREMLALGILVSYTSRLLILEPISKIGFWFKIPTSPKGFAGTSAAGL
jgi:hypothetical protein